MNGTLKVQPAIATTTTNTPTTTGAGATNPDAGSFGTPAPDSTTIVTVLGGVDGTSTSSTGGGAEINTNGDATLKSATGSTTTGSYTRLTTVDLYNADQGALAGTPVPGTQKYFAAYPDPANPGKYLPLAAAFTGPTGLADLDAFVASTAITAPVFAPLALTPTPLAATGGNLTVEGATSTQGIDNNGKKITELAAGVAPTDAANVGQVTAGDAAVTTAFQAADAAVTTAFQAADAVLTTGLASEVTNRTNADLSIRNDYTAADTLERNARIAADNSIRSDYQAADRGLRSDIDQNTRGIAMVAAMTNTTVAEGKTHGVDFNLAQFQSETGMSFGYANRINENLQIHAAAASTTDFDEAVGRIGVSYQW